MESGRYKILGYKQVYNGSTWVKITLDVCKEVFNSDEYETCVTVNDYWDRWVKLSEVELPENY